MQPDQTDTHPEDISRVAEGPYTQRSHTLWFLFFHHLTHLTSRPRSRAGKKLEPLAHVASKVESLSHDRPPTINFSHSTYFQLQPGLTDTTIMQGFNMGYVFLPQLQSHH